MYESEDEFTGGPRLWTADPTACCAAYQLGACSHTEAFEYAESEPEAPLSAREKVETWLRIGELHSTMWAGERPKHEYQPDAEDGACLECGRQDDARWPSGIRVHYYHEDEHGMLILPTDTDPWNMGPHQYDPDCECSDCIW